MNEVERYGQQPFDGPIYREGPAPKLISRRLSNVLLTGFVLGCAGLLGPQRTRTLVFTSTSVGLVVLLAAGGAWKLAGL